VSLSAPAEQEAAVGAVEVAGAEEVAVEEAEV